MAARQGFSLAIWLLVGLSTALPAGLRGQEPPLITATGPELPDAPSSTIAQAQSQGDAPERKPQPQASPDPTQPQSQDPVSQKKQPKRILWVIPNYRAVSADVYTPPLDGHGKFRLMVDDTFDYSAFLYVGFVAGLRTAAASYPEFGEGAAAYGQYYWRSFVDNASGNTFTEWLLPVVFKQDPRYFTKGYGSFFSRAGYAASRLVVTRSDKGTEQFNISEIGGNLAAGGLSNAYYPAPKRGVGNTFNNWAVQLGLDGTFNVLKEFWPDIAHKVFHQD